MKKIFFIVFLILSVSCDAMAQQVTTAAARSTGWKRLAYLPGQGGRGHGTVTISSTGGDHTPIMATVNWYHDWSNLAGLSVQSESKNSPYWNEFRITSDTGGIYIEANFTSTVLGLRLASDDYGWNPAVLYSGTLPEGGGSIRAQIRTGRLNIEDHFQVNFNGNIGIGTATPTNKLDVNGTVRAKEVKLEATNWPDYVFDEGYELMSLKEIKAHIDHKGHLPGLKSAKDYKSEGVNIMDLNQKLLEKIEELTLHAIRQQKKLDDLEMKLEGIIKPKEEKP